MKAKAVHLLTDALIIIVAAGWISRSAESGILPFMAGMILASAGIMLHNVILLIAGMVMKRRDYIFYARPGMLISGVVLLLTIIIVRSGWIIPGT